MQILIFEYFTASGITDKTITSEAKALLDGVLDDLKEYNITYLISKVFSQEYQDKYPDKKAIILDETCNITDPCSENKLETWLQENIKDYDACLLIATEIDNTLYKLAKIVEDNNVLLLGSNSESIMQCTNKIETLKNIPPSINNIETHLITTDLHGKWKQEIMDLLIEKNPTIDFTKKNNNPDLINKLIAKPQLGIDCEGVIQISSQEDIEKISLKYPIDANIIIQDYIEGIPCSVSLIVLEDKIIPLSLNKQEILITDSELEYNGGEVPYKHPLEEKAKQIAKQATQSIPGLKGFIGVDLILNNNNIYFLEINPRFTTPYVGLRKIINFNIVKTIVDSIKNNKISQELPEKIEYHSQMEFIKKGENLEIK